MSIDYVVLLLFTLVLGVDVVRAIRLARCIDLKRQDMQLLILCYCGALAGSLVAAGALMVSKVNDSVACYIIGGMILIWISLSEVIRNLLVLMNPDSTIEVR